MADQEEMKTPVFSVLKNGIIIKNIFLNNLKWEDSNQNQDQEDDFILIGRHPDCHIVLDHPSISRFHLEIRAQPVLQKLSMIDRASVHGTWVSGEKIRPNVPTDLVEGDTVKLGASTRVYKLHWVSMSSAFKMEKPFLPALPEESEEESHQLEDPNVMCAQEIPSAPPLLDTFSLPLVNNNQILAVMEFEEKGPISYSAVPVSESIIGSLTTEGENRTPEKNGKANEVQSERENKSPLKSLSLLSRRSKSSLRIHTGRTDEKMGERSSTKELDIERKGEEILCRVLFAGSKEEEDEEACDSDKQNVTPSSQKCHKSNHEPSLNSSAILMMREELFHLAKETLSCEDPNSPKQNRPISATCVKKRDEACALDKTNNSLEELQKSSLKAITALIEEDCVFYSDKENWTPELPSKMKSKKAIHIDCIQTNGGEQEDEAFISDEENVTPIISGSRKSKKLLPVEYSNADGGEACFSDKENTTPITSGVKKSKKEPTESQIRIERLIIERRKERIPFQSLLENSPTKIGSSPLMKSKKPIHIDCIQTNGGEQEDEAFISDEENVTPIISGSRKSKKLLPVEYSNADGGEACFSDKENMTPITSVVKKSTKELTESQIRTERLIIERRKERIPFQSLLENSPTKIGSSPLKTEHNIVNKERTPFKPLLEKSPSKNRGLLNDAQRVVGKERVPFQSLQSSPLRNSNPVSNARKKEATGNKYSSFILTQATEDELRINSSIHSLDQVCHKVERNKKKWNMVVDTDCFLNEESRKSLQLLEGLKGTQLIIPSIVIRELDCLKRRESLFRKETKMASSVLQWIEECMVKSNWWIHVQSSLETKPVALTPPPTPRTEFCDRSLMEIVSPTAEDHILNCALMFKRVKDEEQLVLLTDSITLKIKAMAEGLLCEMPIEFRESLVNPYSKRFLWSAGSPRESTWSCLDEAGLIENYCYQFPAIRKTSKATETIRGLKLLLLHNSHYGQTSSVN